MGCANWTTMTDQKQETDRIGRIARWAGLVLLAGLVFPAVRRTISGFGFWGVTISLLVITGLLGFGIYRLTAWTRRMKAADENPFALPADGSDPDWGQDESEGTLELCRPALRRRYPWRR
jgi:hypothetical protein